MSEPGNIPVAGQEFLLPEWAISQFVIPAGAGGVFANANSATVGAGGICTFTTNAAHGLTMTPAAGVPANYFVTFGGTTSGITGTGVLVGNVFRILSIPSTTTFTFWSTISTATVTSTSVIPVFFPTMQQTTIVTGASPTQTIATVVTPEPLPLLGYAEMFCSLGANCNIYYNPDQLQIALDQYTTASTGTPASVPVNRVALAASAAGNVDGAYPWLSIWANGTTATSRISVHV